MISTVTGKNQITIPAQLVKQLDIQPGARLDWSISEDGILLARVLPPRGLLARKAAGMGRKWLSKGGDPIAELLEERLQDEISEGLA